MKKWIRYLTFLRNDVPLRLTIKLYGTLSRSFDEYDHLSGLEVNIPEEASINDLLDYLNLSSERLGMIYMDGKLLNKKSQLKDGAQIKIFQPISGG
jgi:sulfur carrier protein ThiS